MAVLPTIQTPELEPRIMADGVASKDVAAELGVHEHTVGKWRRRFLKERCEGLLDEARPGRPRSNAANALRSRLVSGPRSRTGRALRSCVKFQC
jgi:transposase-like protein